MCIMTEHKICHMMMLYYNLTTFLLCASFLYLYILFKIFSSVTFRFHCRDMYNIAVSNYYINHETKEQLIQETIVIKTVTAYKLTQLQTIYLVPLPNKNTEY
jgi:hypothetical protein